MKSKTDIPPPHHVSKLFKAGIPDGVLNVVTGFGQTAGAALSSHMDVDMVTQLDFFQLISTVHLSNAIIRYSHATSFPLNLLFNLLYPCSLSSRSVSLVPQR